MLLRLFKTPREPCLSYNAPACKRSHCDPNTKFQDKPLNPPFRWDQVNPVFFGSDRCQTEFRVLKNPEGRFDPDQMLDRIT